MFRKLDIGVLEFEVFAYLISDFVLSCLIASKGKKHY